MTHRPPAAPVAKPQPNPVPAVPKPQAGATPAPPKSHINAAAGAKPAPPLPAAPVASAAAPAPSLDAFFRRAGLPAQPLDDKQADQVLHRLGQLMREVVLGVTENLHLRAEQKNVLRVPTTTIQPQNNNPLKFAASVEEALNNLLFRESPEYLSAVEAIRDTFGDIKQHQQHLLAAMRTAVVDYVGRLDPEELEHKIGNGRIGLLNAANKLKYWDLFKDLYEVVSAHQPGQFPHQFLQELAQLPHKSHEDAGRADELEETRSVPAGGAARQAKLG